MSTRQIITRVEGTQLVGYWPGCPHPLARVDLPHVAGKLGAYKVGADELAPLNGFAEVGRFGDRFRKFVKKVIPPKVRAVVSKVAHAAQKLVHSKVFSAITGVLSVALPQPIGAMVGAGAAILRRTTSLVKAAKSNPKAKQALVFANAVGEGKASLANLKKATAKLGVDYRDAKAAAVARKLAGASKVSPQARAVLSHMNTLYKAEQEALRGTSGPNMQAAALLANKAQAPRTVRVPKAEPPIRRSMPGAFAYETVIGGKRYRSIVTQVA